MKFQEIGKKIGKRFFQLIEWTIEAVSSEEFAKLAFYSILILVGFSMGLVLGYYGAGCN